MIEKPKIVIAGGTGFFGKYLVNYFKKDYSIIVLTRRDSYVEDQVDFVNWDGKNDGEWSGAIEGAEVLINLSGKSINCKFTEANKRMLLSSRIDSTKALVKAVGQLKRPPKLFLNASSGAMYQLLDGPNVETDKKIKEGFLSELALKWEEEFFKTDLSKTRRASLRISLILGKDGGVYEVLNKLTKLYSGGAVGSGKQIMSWIHIEDAVKAVEAVFINDKLEGPINFSTAEPVSNTRFMRGLRKSLGVSFGFPAPAFGLKLASNFIDIEPSLVLNSVNFTPQKLLDNGFMFSYEKLEEAFEDLK